MWRFLALVETVFDDATSVFGPEDGALEVEEVKGGAAAEEETLESAGGVFEGF